MPYSIFFTQKGHAIHGTNHEQHRPPGLAWLRAAVGRQRRTLFDLVKEHGQNTKVVLTGEIPDSDAGAIARQEPFHRGHRLAAAAAHATPASIAAAALLLRAGAITCRAVITAGCRFRSAGKEPGPGSAHYPAGSLR